MFLRSSDIEKYVLYKRTDSIPLLNAVGCNLNLLRPVFAYVNTHRKHPYKIILYIQATKKFIDERYPLDATIYLLL